MYRDFANMLVLSTERMQMTQEQLAELCGVYRQTISNYYRGVSLPSPETVQRLEEVLHMPALSWEWLRANPIGRDRLPSLPEMPLSQAYANFYSATSRVRRMNDDLVEIVKDNLIEPHELKTYQTGSAVIGELIAYGARLNMATKEKSTAPTVLR